jgi:hypothetical protein
MDATLARRKKEERKPARKPREAEPAPASTPEPEHAPAAGVPLFLRRAPASSAPAPAASSASEESSAGPLGEVAVAPADDALEREAESIAEAVASAAPALAIPPAATPAPSASPDGARVSKTYKKASASPDATIAPTAERGSTARKKAPASAEPASAASPARVSKTYKKAPTGDDRTPAADAGRVSKAYKNSPATDAGQFRAGGNESAAEAEGVYKTYDNPPAAPVLRVYKTYEKPAGGQPAPAKSTVPAFLRGSSSAVSNAGLGTVDAEQEREAETSTQTRTGGANASAAPSADGGLYKTYKNDAGAQSASAGSTTPAYLRRATHPSAAPEASSRAEIHHPPRVSSRELGAATGGVPGPVDAEESVPSTDPQPELGAASGAAGAAGSGAGSGAGDADDATPPLLAEAEGAAAGSASGAAGGSAGGDAGDGDAADASSAALAEDVARDALPFAPLPAHSRTDALPHSRTPGGDPLPDGIRFILEAILGADLAGVRIHKQPEDREAARELDARAFALGPDIWLGPGESDHDVRLMAHEVAHVLQGDHLLRRAPSTAAKKPKSKEKKEKKDKKPKAGDASTGTGAAASAAPPAPASGGDPVSVPLLMPEPPAELTPAAKARVREVKSESKGAAEAQADMPPAEAVTDGTRAAVAEPAAEAAGRAQGELVEDLDEAPEPSPEIEELCKKIYAAIKGKRPPDEDKLVEAKPEEMAREAGGQLDGNVRGDTERVQGGYDAIGETPAGEPAPAQQDLETPPATTDAPAVHATKAVPDAVPAENVSLDADVEAGAAKMEDAGMNKEPAQLVESGPIAEAREAQGELATKAAEDPAKVLAAQAEARGKAAEDMAALQAKALAALRRDRKETAGGVGTQQGEMVKQEAVTRESVGIKAEKIFKKAQKDVRDLLRPLPTTAMERWNAEKAILSQEFKDSLAKVKKWIDKRHEGIGGSILSAGDYLFGLPKWVTREYDQAEKKFGDGVCRVIREISVEVNRVILACEAIVEQANREIAKLYTDLPDDLTEWAAGEKARFAEQLEGLKNEARTTRDTFNKDLVQRAGTAVQEVREEIYKLRQEAGGLVGRVIDAVGRFLDDPVKFIIEGLLELVGIPPASFWALVNRISQVIDDIADDPLGFANNLLSGVAQGFDKFFGAIGKHLVGGFFDWLFSGLGAVGVQLPSDFSLKSIVTFALELMGITWTRVRRLLAKHIGEKNVALLEKAYELVAGLMEKGPEGIFEMIKEKLDPRMIIDQVIQAGIEFLTEALIKNVSARIVLLFNPAGAIVQALEAIYRVLKWVFENAARLFSFVETVVNGMAQVVAGNISGMATAVEGALARLIAPVIDFLADYIGLGDLPEKIAEVIKGFQGWVEGILDTVIAFIARKAKDLLAALGIGKGKDEKPPAGQQGDGEIGETVRFAAAGESHRVWIKTEGTQATIMSASAPLPVEKRLEMWSKRPGSVAEPRREEARNLIDSARALLGEGDKLADRLAVAFAQANQLHQAANAEPGKEIDRLDNSLEGTEQALSTILARLYELYEQKIDLRVIYQHQISRMDPAVRPEVERYLSPGSEQVPDGLEVSWDKAKTWLAGRPVIHDILHGPLLASHEFGRQATLTQAIPALRDAVPLAPVEWTFFGLPEEQDEGIKSYAEARKALINRGGPPFAQAYQELVRQAFDADNRAAANAALVEGFASKLRGDRFAHLATPEIQQALRDAKKEADWVAAFATGGILLRAAPGTDTPLTLADVWKNMGTSERAVIQQVTAAVHLTLTEDPGYYTAYVSGQADPLDVARDYATQVVRSMATVPLYVVKNTDIPRDVEGGGHVLLNSAATVARTNALYTAIGEASANRMLSGLGGQIHHVVPLYLGGGHPETNLMRAEGDARIRAGMRDTAHHIMHEFIDNLEIVRFVDGIKVKLREPDLRRAFPDDAVQILIGVLYPDGRIAYQETPLKYSASSHTKVIP